VSPAIWICFKPDGGEMDVRLVKIELRPCTQVAGCRFDWDCPILLSLGPQLWLEQVGVEPRVERSGCRGCDKGRECQMSGRRMVGASGKSVR
jgi:hypothetical protein